MSILAMRTAIVARLRADLALDDSFIQAHPRAVFLEDDLNATLKNTSLAIRVAFAGVPEDAEWSSDEVDAPCAWVIYVAAKDLPATPTVPRDQVVLGALPGIMHVVAQSNWTNGGCYRGEAERIRVAPLYEGEVDGKSACVWSVSWRQLLALPPADSDDIRAFTSLITKYDLVPKDGVFEAEDEINMGSA